MVGLLRRQCGHFFRQGILRHPSDTWGVQHQCGYWHHVPASRGSQSGYISDSTTPLTGSLRRKARSPASSVGEYTQAMTFTRFLSLSLLFYSYHSYCHCPYFFSLNDLKASLMAVCRRSCKREAFFDVPRTDTPAIFPLKGI